MSCIYLKNLFKAYILNGLNTGKILPLVFFIKINRNSLCAIYCLWSLCIQWFKEWDNVAAGSPHRGYNWSSWGHGTCVLGATKSFGNPPDQILAWSAGQLVGQSTYCFVIHWSWNTRSCCIMIYFYFFSFLVFLSAPCNNVFWENEMKHDNGGKEEVETVVWNY